MTDENKNMITVLHIWFFSIPEQLISGSINRNAGYHLIAIAPSRLIRQEITFRLVVCSGMTDQQLMRFIVQCMTQWPPKKTKQTKNGYFFGMYCSLTTTLLWLCTYLDIPMWLVCKNYLEFLVVSCVSTSGGCVQTCLMWSSSRPMNCLCSLFV